MALFRGRTFCRDIINLLLQLKRFQFWRATLIADFDHSESLVGNLKKTFQERKFILLSLLEQICTIYEGKATVMEN